LLLRRKKPATSKWRNKKKGVDFGGRKRFLDSRFFGRKEKKRGKRKLRLLKREAPLSEEEERPCRGGTGLQEEERVNNKRNIQNGGRKKFARVHAERRPGSAT